MFSIQYEWCLRRQYLPAPRSKLFTTAYRMSYLHILIERTTTLLISITGSTNEVKGHNRYTYIYLFHISFCEHGLRV